MSIQNQARSLMMNHHKQIKNREQSMLNRAAAEIGIDIDVKYHTHIQGKTVQDFAATYDRSNAAMS
jgi:hypothetical protein